MARKFEFHEKLYLGESIEVKKVDKIKKKLRSKLLLSNEYLILPARNQKEQLDIMEAKQLAQRHYDGATFLVIGIAADYKDALGVIERLVQDCLKERGDCKLREYLSC